MVPINPAHFAATAGASAGFRMGAASPNQLLPTVAAPIGALPQAAIDLPQAAIDEYNKPAFADLMSIPVLPPTDDLC